MDKTWLKFERLVAAIHYAESQGAKVKWNDKINGRQFDVTLRFTFGLHDYLTVIECKDTEDRVAAEKVDALVTKAKDVNANKVIMVSSSGYQSGCYEVAQRHGIKLLTLNEKLGIDINQLVSEVTPALNIYEVYLIRPNGNIFAFEDEGGRLHYLMNRVRLISTRRDISPNQLMTEWQVTHPHLEFDVENKINLILDDKTIARIPHEGEIEAISIQFKCKLVQAFIAKQPMLDIHILEGISTKYELTDEKGHVLHAINSSDLKLGFDTKIAPGKFYSNPKLHMYYYCASVDNNNLITWILIESYQHGNLIQATFTQEAKYGHYYVEVDEPKKLDQLKRLLADYRGNIN
jgi:hypothetical protein